MSSDSLIQQVQDLISLADQATPGPWWFDENEHMWRLHGQGPELPAALGLPLQRMNKQILKAPKKDTPYAEYWPDAADAAWIVAANPEAISTLLKQLLRKLENQNYDLFPDQSFNDQEDEGLKARLLAKQQKS